MIYIGNCLAVEWFLIWKQNLRWFGCKTCLHRYYILHTTNLPYEHFPKGREEASGPERSGGSPLCNSSLISEAELRILKQRVLCCSRSSKIHIYMDAKKTPCHLTIAATKVESALDGAYLNGTYFQGRFHLRHKTGQKQTKGTSCTNAKELKISLDEFDCKDICKNRYLYPTFVFDSQQTTDCSGHRSGRASTLPYLWIALLHKSEFWLAVLPLSRRKRRPWNNLQNRGT